MDLQSSLSSEKSKNESTRIPSPASVSSVHSIRPLEWDSGADIGYEFKHQSDLSTVERIALKSGTVNLLENCISERASSDRFYSRRYIGSPVAQSSPFVLEVMKVDPSSSKTSSNLLKPLVDYSISSYSFNEETDHFESEEPIMIEVLEKKSDRVLKVRSTENSKSLDDLRYLGCNRRPKPVVSCRSRSSQNLLITVPKNSSEKNSSSSLVTLVPLSDEFRDRKYSNKSVQVDEISLIMDQEKNDAPPKSSLEFFRKICNDETNDNDSRNTRSKKGSNSDNDEESVDGGSFEYVPGSRYASQTLDSKFTSDTGSKDASSVNTLCSDVTDGVALLTRYVNDLKIEHKRKVMEKVVKSLLNNLSNQNGLRKSSSESRTKSRTSNLLLNSSPEMNARISSNSLRKRSPIEFDFRSSNLETNSQSSSSNYLQSKSSTNNSRIPATASETCLSSESSNRLPASLNSYSCSVGARSSCKTDSNSDLKSSPTKQRMVSPQFCNLKEYLKKERDAQLSWIKSNIDHLNNLRKLYESQKVLQSELNVLKKLTAPSQPGKKTLQTDHTEVRTPRKKQIKPIFKGRPVTKKTQTISSSITSNSTTLTTSCSNYGVLSASESVQRSSKKTRKDIRLNERKQTEIIIEKDVCQCSCRHCRRKINKENVLDSANGCTRSEEFSLCRKLKCVTSQKPSISYTILFNKGPNFNVCKNFKIKEHFKQKSESRPRNKGRRIKTIKSVAECQSISANRVADQTVSLQDYLINNKPEYVNRAEYRRKCLAEIAKLRELRDKCREELLSAVRNVDEASGEIAKSITAPPPLSVVRLFDDRTMKKETERKYQQLPEVLSKKVEMRRRDMYHRNHIMAKVFTKKLQKKVLKGQVNLANNVNVLSM